MTWTVHRLECPFLLLNIQNEHIILVVLPMTRGLPQFAVIHVRRYDWMLSNSMINEDGKVHLLDSLFCDTRTQVLRQ